jgi:hypothetical protein
VVYGPYRPYRAPQTDGPSNAVVRRPCKWSSGLTIAHRSRLTRDRRPASLALWALGSRRNSSKRTPCHAATPRFCAVARSQRCAVFVHLYASIAYSEQKANKRGTYLATRASFLTGPWSLTRKACLGTPAWSGRCSMLIVIVIGGPAFGTPARTPHIGVDTLDQLLVLCAAFSKSLHSTEKGG